MLSHCVIIVSYTIVAGLIELVKIENNSFIRSTRLNSGWIFVGGIADLFISCTIWFITDD